MARVVQGGFSLMADFTSVAKFIGSSQGMLDSLKDPNYQDALITAAHAETEEVFNVEAAAAAATGAAGIKHMFEWGTAGVNRGRTNVRPQPTAERARLWATHLTGHGFNKTMTYVFKPSIAIVPKPTKRDTGMSTDVISSLGDHVFKAKAMVMETGSMVTIVPKQAKFLLIPYYKSQHGSTMFSDADIERGFTLSKGPHTHSPGDTSGTTGNFTAFWTGWWNSAGNKLMEASVDRQLQQDFAKDIMINKSDAPMPIRPGTFEAEVAKARKQTKNRALAKARTRKRTK